MSNRGAPLLGAELWTVDVVSGALRRLTRTPFEDADPAWR
jgi:hypothetical protein